MGKIALQPPVAHVPALGFLQAVAAAADAAPGRIIVACEPDLELASSQLEPIAAVVEEALSNALRHAYPDGEPGKVWVALGCERGRMKLSIRDHGVGFPVLEDRPSEGRALVLRAAGTLRGYARFDNRNYGGAEVTVVFPQV